MHHLSFALAVSVASASFAKPTTPPITREVGLDSEGHLTAEIPSNAKGTICLPQELKVLWIMEIKDMNQWAIVYNPTTLSVKPYAKVPTTVVLLAQWKDSPGVNTYRIRLTTKKAPGHPRNIQFTFPNNWREAYEGANAPRYAAKNGEAYQIGIQPHRTTLVLFPESSGLTSFEKTNKDHSSLLDDWNILYAPDKNLLAIKTYHGTIKPVDLKIQFKNHTSMILKLIPDSSTGAPEVLVVDPEHVSDSAQQ